MEILANLLTAAAGVFVFVLLVRERPAAPPPCAICQHPHAYHTGRAIALLGGRLVSPVPPEAAPTACSFGSCPCHRYEAAGRNRR